MRQKKQKFQQSIAKAQWGGAFSPVSDEANQEKTVHQLNTFLLLLNRIGIKLEQAHFITLFGGLLNLVMVSESLTPRNFENF